MLMSTDFCYTYFYHYFFQDNSTRNPPRKKVNLKNRKIKTKLTNHAVTSTELTSMRQFSMSGDESKKSTTSLLPGSKDIILVSPSSSHLGGGMWNDLENLQSLVAHLDRKDEPLTTLESKISFLFIERLIFTLVLHSLIQVDILSSLLFNAAPLNFATRNLNSRLKSPTGSCSIIKFHLKTLHR